MRAILFDGHGLSVVFLPALLTYAACPDDIIANWKMDEPTPSAPNGTYADYIKGNNGTGGAVNPTAQDGIVNGAQLFNGTTTQINVPADNSFDWQRNESFSIEFWVKTDGTVPGTDPEDNMIVIGRRDASTSLAWWAGIRFDGKAAFSLRDTAGNGVGVVGGAGGINLSDGDWHHMVAVRDESTNENIVYVDGIEQGRGFFNYLNGFASASAALNIGWWDFPNTSGYYFDGLIDEIAIYDRALPLDEIREHYNAGLGMDYCSGVAPFVPFPDDTVALWQLDEPTPPANNRYEDAFNGNYGTGGAVTPTAQDGIVNGAQLFNGTTTQINVPADNSFDWQRNESFSIEFWVKTDGTVPGTDPEDNMIVIGRRDASTSLAWWAGIRFDGKAAFSLRDTAGNGVGVVGGASGINLANGDWHHMVAVRDESTNENIVYVDGIEQGREFWNYTNGFASASAALNIGWWDFPNTSGYYFDGLIDEVAIYDRALPLDEIQEHYDAGRLLGLGILSLRPEPVADAGDDQTVAVGTTPVTLDGSGSSDENGTIVSHLWEQLTGSGVTLATPSPDTATFTAPNVAGTLTFRLTVTDDDGLTSTDDVAVFVTDNTTPPPPPPVADSGGGGGGGCFIGTMF